jgi:type II secretory pathway pseudopilin PulG
MPRRARNVNDDGFAMAALLVAMTVMAIAMSVALPVWHTMAQREKEEELIFRGEQYARAVALYQRRFPGAVPPTLQVLLDAHLLRKKYKDPMTNDDFQLVGPNDAVAAGGAPGVPTTGLGQTGSRGSSSGQTGRAATPPQPSRSGSAGPAAAASVFGPGAAAGGILGVVSKSKATSLRLYNGRNHYDEWVFVATAQSNRAGGPGGTNQPGVNGRGGPNQPGVPPGGTRGGGPGPGGRFGTPPVAPGRGRF